MFRILLGSRASRVILTSFNHEFYAPERIIYEIKKKIQIISEMKEIKSKEVEAALNDLSYFIKIIDYEKYKKHMPEAEHLIGHRDIKDADYVACALTVKADFIWSEDKDFTEQTIIPVRTTQKFIEENKM